MLNNSLHKACRCYGKNGIFKETKIAHIQGAAGCLLDPERFHGTIHWYDVLRDEGQIRAWGHTPEKMCVFEGKDITNVSRNKLLAAHLSGKHVMFSLSLDSSNDEYLAKEIVLISAPLKPDSEADTQELATILPIIHNHHEYRSAYSSDEWWQAKKRAKKKLFIILSKEDIP